MKTLTRPLAALLAALAVLALSATPAGAHGGEGQMEIVSTVRTGLNVVVEVRLTYVEDGHGVPDATVTAVVDEGTPRPMEPGEEEGDYTISIAAPPGSTIRITSVEPATTAETSAPDMSEVTPTLPPTTAAPSTTAGGDEEAASEDGPTTEAPADTAPEPNGIDEAPEDDEGSSGTVIVLVAVVVVIVAALAAAFILRRKRPDEV